MAQLKTGDLVVHRVHGVGRFHGLRRVAVVDTDQRRFAMGAGESPDEGAIERYYNRFVEYYMAAPAARSAPFPGAAEVLQNLSAAGVALGVCTNKPHGATLRVLDALALLPYFAAVLGGDALDVRKPDAGHLRAVLAAMGAGADSAAMVGDSEIDVAAARNAGVPVIVVDFGYTALAPAELGADGVISHLGDLPDALARIAG